MSGLERLKSIEADMKAAREKMMSDGREAMQNAFEEIFKTYPNLASVKWVQYTPYFNDGDACEFRVNDFSIELSTLSDNEDIEDDYGNVGYISCWDMKYYSDDYSKKLNYENRNENHPDLKIFADLAVIERQEDLLEAVYGDHVKVTVYRNGETEVDDYHHE